MCVKLTRLSGGGVGTGLKEHKWAQTLWEELGYIRQHQGCTWLAQQL